MLGRRKSSDELNREARHRGTKTHRVGTTEIVVPDPEVRELTFELERTQREISRAEEKPKARPACWKHPDWKPKTRSDQQPHPPQGFCPYCREAEEHADRRPAASEVLANGGASDFLRRDEDWEANWKLAKPHEPVPGSEEEARYLSEMDSTRDRVMRQERQRAEHLRRFEKVESISDYDSFWAR
jgi:hypothetical protein